MAKRTAAIHGPKSTMGLDVQGKSKKVQGDKAGEAWKADVRQVPMPTMGNRGPGSAFAHALLREEAKRLKSEAKVPGNLGYKQPVDISRITHKNFQKRGK